MSLRICKRNVAIAKNIDLIEQNQCDFWNQQNYRKSPEKLQTVFGCCPVFPVTTSNSAEKLLFFP